MKLYTIYSKLSIQKFPLSNLLLSLSLLLSFPVSAQKSQEVNPVYIASLLVDDISSDRMAQTCRFHHLAEAPSENSFTVFTDSKGNQILFKKTDNQEDGVNGKLIEVRTTESNKAIEKILKETGYEKREGGYEKGSRLTNSLTRCTLVSQNKTKILRFNKVKK